MQRMTVSAWVLAFGMCAGNVGLVYQGGRLDRVVGALQLHIAGGQSPEFAINQRNQCIGGCLIPTAGCA